MSEESIQAAALENTAGGTEVSTAADLPQSALIERPTHLAVPGVPPVVDSWTLAPETVVTQHLADHLRELTAEALGFENGFPLAPDRYVLRVLAVLAAIRTATERAQRLIVERNILS